LSRQILSEFEERYMQHQSCPKHYIRTLSAYHPQYIQFSTICGMLEHVVSAMLAVPRRELRSARRCDARVAFARQVAMYLAHVALGLSMTRVGALFGRDRTTVAHGCAVVEDRRDEPAFDRALHIAEHALRVSYCLGTNSGENR
jgi:chromosomal replication initiation ATPase DnaA